MGARCASTGVCCGVYVSFAAAVVYNTRGRGLTFVVCQRPCSSTCRWASLSTHRHIGTTQRCGAAGVRKMTQRTANVQYSGLGHQKHHQNSTNIPRERREHNETLGGGRNQSVKFLAPPSGPPTLRARHLLGPLFQVRAPPFGSVRV